MSCTGYWSTKDGCCEKCHKPIGWKELRNYHNYCAGCFFDLETEEILKLEGATL